MSPKAKKAAKAEKAETKPAKMEKKSAKSAKTVEKAGEQPPALNPDGSPVDLDELEEAADAAAARSSSAGGDEAALAAASGSGEMSASFKNFRHHPDMENFYRFIYENDLRH